MEVRLIHACGGSMIKYRSKHLTENSVRCTVCSTSNRRGSRRSGGTSPDLSLGATVQGGHPLRLDVEHFIFIRTSTNTIVQWPFTFPAFFRSSITWHHVNTDPPLPLPFCLHSRPLVVLPRLFLALWTLQQLHLLRQRSNRKRVLLKGMRSGQQFCWGEITLVGFTCYWQARSQ